MKLHDFIQFETKHFIRNRFKVLAVIVFILGCLYTIRLGNQMRENQLSQIQNQKDKSIENKAKVLGWYDSGQLGPKESPWVNISEPFWAIWYTPSHVYKFPSPLMGFSIGQAESFAYQKSISNWSTVYDNDLIGEIANPERISVGSIDFGFMVLYLAPLLLIILLFNINGLEHDLGINTIIRTQSTNPNLLLLARSTYYTCLLIALLFLMVVFSGLITGAVQSHLSELIFLFLLIASYLLLWQFFFFWLIKTSSGSNGQAIRMICVWIVFCVLIPGYVHQMADTRFPENFKTDYLDVNRIEIKGLFDLPVETRANNLKSLFPSLQETIMGKDSIPNVDATNYSSSSLANELMKKAALELEEKNGKKNSYIISTYWYNPVTFFQNKINAISETDYHAYQNFRDRIQSTIDQKNELIVLETWDDRVVDKNQYLTYFDKCNASQ